MCLTNICSQLFGNSEDEEALENDESEENGETEFYNKAAVSNDFIAQELAALSRETAELKQIKEAAGSADYAKKVFDKVYNTDINRLLSMESMWAKRAKPTPLDYDTLERESAAAETSTVGLADQKVWTLKENFEMFKDSVVRLAARYLKERETQSDAILSFDKDDDDAMDFVTAASNLRAHVFNIPSKSLFDVKCKLCRCEQQRDLLLTLFKQPWQETLSPLLPPPMLLLLALSS